jgi:hypothetical protein
MIGAMLALGLSLVGASAAGGAGVSFRHCGTLHGPGARFAILAHQARCRTARRVIAAVFAGRGRRRRDPVTGQMDRVVDGWICGSAAGGFSCGKLGPGGTIRPTDPRHIGPVIDAEAL